MQDLAKQQKVMLLTDGIQLWIDSDRADAFMAQIRDMAFDDIVEYEGRSFTRRMFLGFFLPGDIESMTKRKNFQWQCKGGQWHDRGENCTCASLEEKKRLAEREQIINNCKKCTNGFVTTDTGVRECDCLIEWRKYGNWKQSYYHCS